MDIPSIIGKWFWAMCIGIMFANVAHLKYRSKLFISQNPTLKEGYKKIIKALLIWGNIPWLIIGLGCMTGGVPSVFYIFRPQDGNPYVLTFYASAFVICIIVTYWLFFQNGAEMLVKHPGLFNIDIDNPSTFKALWVICILAGVVGFIAMLTENIPIPIK